MSNSQNFPLEVSQSQAKALVFGLYCQLGTVREILREGKGKALVACDMLEQYDETLQELLIELDTPDVLEN